MKTRQQYENRYCNPCQRTTRHENRKDGGVECLRCGTEKFRVHKAGGHWIVTEPIKGRKAS